MEEWTKEEAGLLNEMKGNCLNKGQYIDKKAKDKFYMLCHLEDYAIQYYEQQEEIEKLKKEMLDFDKQYNYLKDKFHERVDKSIKYAKEIERLKEEIARQSKALCIDDKLLVDYRDRLAKIQEYLRTIHKEARYGILSSENLIYENINRLCEGKDLIKSLEEDNA